MINVRFIEDRYDVVFDIDDGLTIYLKDRCGNLRRSTIKESELRNGKPTLKNNEVIVDNNADNQGMVESLIGGKIVYPKAKRYIDMGFIKYYVYQLTPIAMKEMQAQNPVKNVG